MIDWRRFFSYKQNWLGLAIIGGFLVVAVAAPWLAPLPEPDPTKPVDPADPVDTKPFKELRSTFYQLPEPPRAGSPLGSVPKPPIVAPGIPLGQGRSYQWDVYHTLIWGTRSALQFGLTVALLSAAFGITVGAVSGYVGGPVGGISMRFTDALLAFPVIAAVWVFERAVFSRLVDPFGLPVELTIWQQQLVRFKIDAIMVALIAFSWMPYARLANATVTQLSAADFVLAAKSMGAKGSRIVFRHLLPNAVAPLVVMTARDIGGMVILASAFIFMGMKGNLAWAVMLVGGRDYIIGLGGNPFSYWWVFLPIALAIILFGIGWNLLGDGLNTALNPRATGRGRFGRQ